MTDDRREGADGPPATKGDDAGGPPGTRKPGARPDRHTFRYPTDHLLAVVDRPDEAVVVARAALSAGAAPGDVHVVAGEDADARLDLLGKDSRIQRALFAVRFMAADQEPDFALYLAALRDGRAVVAVRVKDPAVRSRVVERLRGTNAHFINVYGRLATEEISPWRGPELPLPGWLKR
jgi:hypothetical protein